MQAYSINIMLTNTEIMVRWREARADSLAAEVVELMIENPSLAWKSILEDFHLQRSGLEPNVQLNSSQYLAISSKESRLYESIADLLIENSRID